MSIKYDPAKAKYYYEYKERETRRKHPAYQYLFTKDGDYIFEDELTYGSDDKVEFMKNYEKQSGFPLFIRIEQFIYIREALIRFIAPVKYKKASDLKGDWFFIFSQNLKQEMGDDYPTLFDDFPKTFKKDVSLRYDPCRYFFASIRVEDFLELDYDNFVNKCFHGLLLFLAEVSEKMEAMTQLAQAYEAEDELKTVVQQPAFEIFQKYYNKMCKRQIMRKKNELCLYWADFEGIAFDELTEPEQAEAIHKLSEFDKIAVLDACKEIQRAIVEAVCKFAERTDNEMKEKE